MRPVRLTLQAFGPYPARSEIDFRAALNAGLFGIYGQTGSGKSTLFSAMTFALFGRPAKEEQEASSLRADHADAGLITEVEFIFEINEKRYVILRRPEQMRAKSRGEGETKSPHEAWIFDATGIAVEAITPQNRGRMIAEKKVGLVDGAITDLLGYGAEQFRQIVLLPQGRFETFLSAKTRERLDILRDLFDVSRYRSLAAWLKSQAETAAKQGREERDLVMRRLEEEGFAGLEELEAGLAEALRAKEAAAAAEEIVLAEQALCGGAFAEGQRLDELIAARARMAAELAGLEARSSEISALEQDVSRAERAAALADLARFAAARAQDSEAAQAAFAQAEAERVRAAEALHQAETALQKQVSEVGENGALERAAQDLTRYAEAAALAEARATEAARARVLAEAKAADVRAKGALNAELTERATIARAALKAAEAAALKRAELGAKTAEISAVFEQAKGYEAAQEARQRAADQAALAETALLDARSKHMKSRDTLAEIKAEARHAEALELAQYLQAGAPCPVCGSAEHPSPAHGRAMSDLPARAEAAEQVAAATEADLRDKERDFSAANALMIERERLLGASAPPAQTAADYAARLHELRAQEAEIAAPDPQAQARLDALEAQIAAQTAALAEATAAQAAAQTAAQIAEERQKDALALIPEALRDAKILAQNQADNARALKERAEADKRLTSAKTEALQAQITAENAQKARAQSAAQAAEAATEFAARLQAAGLAPADFEALQPLIAQLDELRTAIKAHHETLTRARLEAQRLEAEIAGRAAPDLAALHAAFTAAEAATRAASQARAASEHRHKVLIKLVEDLTARLKTLEAHEAQTAPLRRLSALANGENPLKLDLETYAIGAMFDQVLAAANLRLEPMTVGRYRLERGVEGAGRGRRGLELQVFDLHTGKARATSTLSGGEGFIAALALALGLADVVENASGKVRLDTVFIDEGFGSLDTENGSGTLNQVLDVLSGLVSAQRAVGIISHVPLVQEAIPNGFYIRKTQSGSVVETRS